MNSLRIWSLHFALLHSVGFLHWESRIKMLRQGHKKQCPTTRICHKTNMLQLRVFLWPVFLPLTTGTHKYLQKALGECQWPTPRFNVWTASKRETFLVDGISGLAKKRRVFFQVEKLKSLEKSLSKSLSITISSENSSRKNVDSRCSNPWHAGHR